MNTRNYYDLLGVSRSATTQEITKAYRRLALENHPDRHGNADIMKEINEIRDVLLDPEKRAIFDEELDATGESADTDTVSGYLATKSQSFSVHYRHQHAQYLEEYEARSIAAISIATQYLQEKHGSQRPRAFPPSSLTITLSVVGVVQYLLMFLDSPDRNTAQVWIHQLQQARGTAEEAKFYALAIDIFSEEKLTLNLMDRLTTYAKQAPEESFPFLLSLFQTAAYRRAATAAFLAINNSANDFQQHFRQFDGEEKTKIKVEVLRQRFIDEGPTTEQGRFLKQKLMVTRLLYRYETDINTMEGTLREKAFQALNWVPSIGGYLGKKALLSLVLRAAHLFQPQCSLKLSHFC